MLIYTLRSISKGTNITRTLSNVNGEKNVESKLKRRTSIGDADISDHRECHERLVQSDIACTLFATDKGDFFSSLPSSSRECCREENISESTQSDIPFPLEFLFLKLGSGGFSAVCHVCLSFVVRAKKFFSSRTCRCDATQKLISVRRTQENLFTFIAEAISSAHVVVLLTRTTRDE
jgi:hypothetical protein